MKIQQTHWYKNIAKSLHVNFVSFFIYNVGNGGGNMENIRLYNGVDIPQLGFGVFLIKDYSECERSVVDALASGYRSIDTAQFYQNEEAVGSGLAQSDVPREEIFLTTKIWPSDYGDEKTRDAVLGSLNRLGTDYLDLVLLHQPFGDYFGAWRALEKLYRQGIIRAIGISNFYPGRYQDFVHFVDIKPMVNQVETHIFYQQEELQKVMAPYGTVLEAWGPLAQGNHDFFNNAEIKAIGDKYGKSNSQVGLRFLLQLGYVVIPKTTHKERMDENFDIFDFELSKDDMAKLKVLDTGQPNQAPHWDPERVKQILSK